MKIKPVLVKYAENKIKNVPQTIKRLEENGYTDKENYKPVCVTFIFKNL